jgi:YD repeat-containing protein
VDSQPARRIVIDGRGNSTVLTLDGDGNVAQAVQPESIVTTYTWDGLMRVVDKTDGRGNTTAFTYETMEDLSRRLATVTRPIGTLSFRYDSTAAASPALRVRCVSPH